MYLKRIELAGFKSFADRTRLNFEPGMMAIVGPNGCGKSNVSDAIRWVLGEQSAKALRGAAMTDVIFNGTDHRKQLGMAEVSLTFGDCEGVLETEEKYNEITVTRRVLRTGEGQYFINKAPCRLKDIHRLFMDTGVGTNSYSMMEQGKIDQILSSRPDDRRAVFEEASGITKFKADKKEALRKLDQTEANLLRLSDIIREVKRQIISLQRQAGKARRYKEIQDKLRVYDLYFSKDKISAFEKSIEVLESRMASLREREEAVRKDVEDTDRDATSCREAMAELERRMDDTRDQAVQARTELGRVTELISSNEARIKDIQDLSVRESREVDEAQAKIDAVQGELDALVAEYNEISGRLSGMEKELQDKQAALQKTEQALQACQQQIHEKRNSLVSYETRSAKLQNELSDLEAKDRSTVIRREKLASEKTTFARSVELFDERRKDMTAHLEQLKSKVDTCKTTLDQLKQDRSQREQRAAETASVISELKQHAAGQQATIDLLRSQEHKSEGFAGGARWLLNEESHIPVSRDRVVGSLAEQLHAEPGFETALEACLRAWLDAVVLEDRSDALKVLQGLSDVNKGSARLLFPSRVSTPCPDGPGSPLLDHVSYNASLGSVAQALLGDVRVVDSLDQLAQGGDASAVLVTREGTILHADGKAEFWSTAAEESNPLARQHKLRSCEETLVEIQKQLSEKSSELETLKASDEALSEELAQAQLALEEARHALAQREGESQVVEQEAKQARDRLETVTFELDAIVEQSQGSQDRRTAIVKEIEDLRNLQAEAQNIVASRTEELKELDATRNEQLSDTTDHKVLVSGQRQQVEHHARRKEGLETRIAELGKLIEERKAGVSSYATRIQNIERMIQDAKGQIEPLQQKSDSLEQAVEQFRNNRAEKAALLKQLDQQVREKRQLVDGVMKQRSDIDVQLAEEKMRYQTLTERVTSEWKLTLEQVKTEKEPEWENGEKPERDVIETTIGEFRAKLESMGPVNLVAIEEHQELEERYAFLNKEEEDLLNAKQQLLDMIRKINTQTTEMFTETFNAVNGHFQEIFKRIFGGGSAKLVLLDEEDVLESGIEIIARPPGKKLQSVSLLSGGERTMTAVALLFALYTVKPSPFCVLDELDAALDDANIGRFVAIVEGFVQGSQFIVITHNRQTISAADVLYGITMDRGVSHIISARFKDHEEHIQPEAKPTADSAPANA